MSEKIYAWLLRLYPSQFRETYGNDALQLFRDRKRDERGFYACLRLWLDLLTDLVVSVPREYFHVQPELVGPSAMCSADGVPAFYFMENKSPDPGALVFGSMTSLAALAVFCILLGQASNYVAVGTLGRLRAESELSLSDKSPVEPRDAASAMSGRRIEGAGLNSAEKDLVINAAVANLNQYYIDRDVAKKMGQTLLAHKKAGDDDAAGDGGSFAGLLTRQMREVRDDRHLVLVYSQETLPEHPMEPSAEEQARYQEAMKRENCGFEKVGILAGNIGYVKINAFPDVTVCADVAADAMSRVNHANAIIYDLRENRGGKPTMVMMMAAYLFDHPEYMYNPRENTTERCWTRSPVAGNRLADKPAYILTSGMTASGAEHFSYDLKMLKRATIVGETTSGAAHSGVWHRIDDHFGMGIPETRAINPFSNVDWAEVGVEPDVRVKAGEALEAAEKLARNQIQKK
jgi:hypothetical protein